MVWNWYHFVAIAILHQPRPTDSADINTRLQLNDTSSIPPMHSVFLLILLAYACGSVVWAPCPVLLSMCQRMYRHNRHGSNMISLSRAWETKYYSVIETQEKLFNFSSRPPVYVRGNNLCICDCHFQLWTHSHHLLSPLYHHLHR